MSVDPFSLAGKRVLVTGASSGIGRQIAISCAGMGAVVVATGRNAGRLEETMQALPGSGHSSVLADLADAGQRKALVAAAGTVDGLVLAAGMSRLVPFRMTGEKHLDETFRQNTFGPLLLTQALVASRQMAQGGSIVFIASVGSHIGPVASSAYAASKSALLGAMRSIGQELAGKSIRANCIAPGYVRTPMLEQLGQGGGKLGDLLELAPLGLGEPEDVANAALYFLSDASRWVTRTYFVVDGGLTIPMSIY
ncbi:SDR family oxidoreductase [Xylophilus sp. Kf1]|nr:SDR family oxidoreductase [Xylophilus sp. Kf1]